MIWGYHHFRKHPYWVLTHILMSDFSKSCHLRGPCSPTLFLPTMTSRLKTSNPANPATKGCHHIWASYGTGTVEKMPEVPQPPGWFHLKKNGVDVGFLDPCSIYTSCTSTREYKDWISIKNSWVTPVKCQTMGTNLRVVHVVPHLLDIARKMTHNPYTLPGLRCSRAL